MKREYGLEQVEKESTSVVTVGTFDGVHVGHRAILQYLVKRARDQRGHSVAVSFSPHPREVVHDEEVLLLTTIEERADLLEDLGLDRFIVIEFTEAFSELRAEAFVEEILVDRIGLQEVVIGYDHAFGRGREGDSDLLAELGEKHGFTVDVIPEQVVNEHKVSSSEIRQQLAGQGAVRLAAKMLGRRYSLRGTVVEGAGRGKSIGFPTANIEVDHPRKLVPKQGVYAVLVYRAEGRTSYGGMMNIGRRPTFAGTDMHVEVHLFDFDDDLYGEELRVEFVERLREEKKFSSREALSEQLSKDEARCKKVLGAVP